MVEATSAVFPDTIMMRELRVQVTQPGFSTRVVLVATTLLDVQASTKEDVACCPERVGIRNWICI
jgi:hypothetical protein